LDGAWSVLIVTTKGDCDRAYRYGVTIANGGRRLRRRIVNICTATSAATAPVRVTHDLRQTPARTLSAASTAAIWQAAAGNGTSGQARCSGYWQASRT